jgi:hypothetical protein
MPRQINPGKSFKRWVPTDSNPNPDEAVFPELSTVAYTDEEWEDPKDNKVLQELKMKHSILNQALYSSLLAMFNDWWETPTTDARKARAVGHILLPGLRSKLNIMEMKASQMRGELLWQEYVVRIIETEPTGHYVEK